MNSLPYDCQFADDETGTRLMTRLSSALDAAFALREANEENAKELLCGIDADLREVDTLCNDKEELLQQSFYAAQMENVRFTLDLIKTSMEQGEEECAASLAGDQLPCVLLELREEIYFWAYVHPWRDRWDAYYEYEFAAHHKNSNVDKGAPRYEVSIFVPAKDKLAYTQKCVQSILQETRDISYELILINHGSTDATQEYFASIPGAKLLHLKENVRMMMFSSAMRMCEGRYMAFVSNDTVVTKDWLTLLLSCIRSDEKIISATPTTPNISNFQATPQSYQTMEEMARFAEGFNRHDPLKWERRARMMPVIALYDLKKLNKIGFTDRYFQTMEFWDDDFSLRARRAGYQQVLCRDVFCHHYGSVTGGEAQAKENTLQKGRALFVRKHGVDPWENGAYYDYQLCAKLQGMSLPSGEREAILGIDCGFGDTLLQMQNLLRRNGTSSSIDTVTMQGEYASDLKGISHTCLTAQDERGVFDCLCEGLAGRQYGLIYALRPLEQYQNWKGLLDLLSGLLAPGGHLLFSLTNALDIVNFQWFRALALPPGKERLNYLNPDAVQAHIKKRLAGVLVQPKRGWAQREWILGIAKQVPPRGLSEEDLIAMLDTVGFQYVCTKEEPPFSV